MTCLRCFLSCSLALLVFLCLVLAGCGDDPVLTSDMAPGVHETVEQGIQGGETDYDNVAVMGMAAINGRSFGICSGSLIAPNLYLTAQHCVSSDVPELIWCGNSEFGTSIDSGGLYVTSDTQMSQRGNYYQGREIVRPPGGNDVCGFDIALVILRENVPASVAKPLTPRIDSPVESDEIYTAIGYGHTGNGRDSGVRRLLPGRRANCVGDDCPGMLTVTATEFYGDSGTCQGDSGGPAMDEHGRVLGALSRGGTGCTDSVYSAVYPWAEWLREVGGRAAELGGYDPPNWVVTGTSDEALDADLDGVLDDVDNCATVSNLEQIDVDDDGLGDECDPDADNDGFLNDSDNCVDVANLDQDDVDDDGLGDACDPDIDDDGLLNEDDNCVGVANTEQSDGDEDGLGDRCDEDLDNDDRVNGEDNCPLTSNTDQVDLNNNGVGDACELDWDEDGVLNSKDNCPEEPNAKQRDRDQDGVGDLCDVFIDPKTKTSSRAAGDGCSVSPAEQGRGTAPLLVLLFLASWVSLRRSREE